MSYRLPVRLWARPSVIILLLLLSGCQREMDCQDAIDAGARLGATGQAAAFDETSFDPACRAAYLQAWESATETLCDPQGAFDLAMMGQPQPQTCQQPAFLRNFQLGERLHALSQERDEINQALSGDQAELETPIQLQQWRMRLRVLEREIPELETLARIRGLMPPAELPPEVSEETSGEPST